MLRYKYRPLVKSFNHYTMSNQPNNKQVSIMAIACVSVIAITMMVLTAMMNVASAQCFRATGTTGDTDVVLGITDVDSGYGALSVLKLERGGEEMVEVCNASVVGEEDILLTFVDGSTLRLKNNKDGTLTLTLGGTKYRLRLRQVEC